ncbi:MAG TPA: non-canonical purine NTP pyrophosphatase [Gemmatimonadaceae bacterium]|jgi:XTP/dITP diphosphohydrolase|nr:non-canonical purine NTP pyrophosphatase [Gemmatimonadaceae bacterium]
MSGDASAPAIVLATRSRDKLRELRPIFAAAGFGVLDLDAAGMPEERAVEELLERYETFEENALAKARHFFERSGGVRPVVADDSGLEVFALGGQPGVRSKRWSERSDLSGVALDAANNEKLLAELEKVERNGSASAEAQAYGRRGRYVCAAAYVDGQQERVFRGECAGHILAAPRGAGGFGYDPLFELEGTSYTFAEIERAAKERVSHRGKAFAQLVAALREWS